jgi:hypothetical protein
VLERHKPQAVLDAIVESAPRSLRVLRFQHVGRLNFARLQNKLRPQLAQLEVTRL